MANRNYNTPPKRKAPKKSYTETYHTRLNQFLDIIQERREMPAYGLKIILFKAGWGPGTFERMCKDVRDNFKKEVQYMKKEKKWISVLPITQKLQEEEKQIEESHIPNPSLVSQQNKELLTS